MPVYEEVQMKYWVRFKIMALNFTRLFKVLRTLEERSAKTSFLIQNDRKIV
jgi:hypothetical protein